MAIDTLFKPNGSGSAGGSSDYVKDVFLDISLPANSNTGLTSTVSTNPLNKYFSNDDTPRFGHKTLFIKDLVLLEDRTKWIDDKPTYEVIWNETNPSVKGYFVGNIRLRTTVQGVCVEVKNPGDIVGITTTGRQVQWLLNPSVAATASASIYTDGVDTTNDVTFNTLVPDSTGTGYNHYAGFIHDTNLQTANIHDYRLVANQYLTLNVVGVEVYFQNATSNIEFNKGTTYVDKVKNETTTNVANALPVVTSQKGARSVLYKTLANTYAVSTIETPVFNTFAQGASGTNLLNVTTGDGASLFAGMGIVVSGLSGYVGSILSVSTDTLTVAPTLPFGLSGAMFNAWQSGTTYPISPTLYQLVNSVDMANANVLFGEEGFGRDAGDYFYTDHLFKFRAWGDALTTNVIDGYRGTAFTTPSSGFLQFDGYFQAAEIEISGAGILHATLMVNGVPAWGINTGMTGIVKKTLFTDAGVGFNSFVLSPGASYSNVLISKVNLYGRRDPIGVTVGVLASLDSAMTRVSRGSAQNATIMQLGNFQRNYADELYLSGQWVRGFTHTVPGGVYYTGSTTISKLNFSYYGTDFAIMGTAGSSAVITLDGASLSVALNTVKSVATLGFHTVVYTHQGGTSTISAFDFLKPQHIELENQQNYVSQNEIRNLPKVFAQWDTPRNPIDGDIWRRDKANKEVWFYMDGVWNKISFSAFSDDPNLALFIRTHGSASSETAASGSADVEHFNFSAWVSGTADTLALSRCQSGESILFNVLRVVDGFTTAGALTLANRSYNKTSWASDSNRGTARIGGGVGVLNNILYVGKGSTGGNATTGTDVLDSYNNVSWTNGAGTFSASASLVSCFTQGGKTRWICGAATSTAAQDLHDTYNGTATATDTLPSVTGYGAAGSTVNGVNGVAMIDATVGGMQGSKRWNGASWSANFNASYVYANETNSTQTGPAGAGSSSGLSYINGGSSAATTSINNTSQFSGTAWAASAVSTLSRAGASGGVL